MRYKAPEFVIDLAWIAGVVLLVYGVSRFSIPAAIITSALLLLAHVFVVANAKNRSTLRAGRPDP